MHIHAIVSIQSKEIQLWFRECKSVPEVQAAKLKRDRSYKANRGLTFQKSLPVYHCEQQQQKKMRTN